MSKRKIIFLTLLILLFLGGVGLGYIKKSYFVELKNLNGVTNFLLLGIRGYDSNNSDLTDTNIFISLDKNSKKAVLLSIPRDLWVEKMQAKINTAYHYGGLDLVRETFSEVLGQPIDYIVVVNFESFGKIVDVLGGVTVNVTRSFDDYEYPIAGKEDDLCNGDKEFKCRYEHVHFEAGLQKMDGQTALKFVRSRNAEGEEGTDFARSSRQQQLILGLKQKIMTSEVFLDFNKVSSLFKVFQENLTVDVNSYEYGRLAVLLSQIDWNQIKNTSIDEKLLVNPKYHYSKQWVLIPKVKDWSEVQQFAQEVLR